MKTSIQDNYYLEHEGDHFFKRNFEDKPVPDLRSNKKTLLALLTGLDENITRVLEYGCNYGDLLNYFKSNAGAMRCIGVEPSEAAIEFGRRLYQDNIELLQGTIAHNSLNNEPQYSEFFDLVIVDDVFGWVSRQTLLQSVANIDDMLANEGYLLLRDFLPDHRTKNRNHHISDEQVFNYKVPGSHASLFLATGSYDIIKQHIYYDETDMSATYRSDNPYNYRWTDILLRKSIDGYFKESVRV